MVDNLIRDIPNRFTLKINKYPFEYSIEDVDVEPDSIDSHIPMIIIGAIGLLIHPLGGMIGVIVGYLVGLNQVRIDESEAKRAKEDLKRLYNNENTYT